jgi:hypothetical protein
VAKLRKVVGQLAGEFDDLRPEDGHGGSGLGELDEANEQLRADAARLKQRIEVVEQENRRV